MRPSVRSSVRRSRRPLWVASFVALGIPYLGEALGSTPRERAPTAADGKVSVAVMADILGQSDGTKALQSTEERTGRLQNEHLALFEAEPKPLDAARRPDAPDNPAGEREPREGASAPRERAEPATVADLERLRVEVARLATAQQALVRRLDELVPPGGAPADPPESALGLTPLLLLVGGGLGWLASRLVQRRRDTRQRNRLRF